VGAGWLANAGVQLKYLWLTPRIRLIRRRGTVSQSYTGFLWELSSFSEAAMTSAQSTSMLPDPPLSRPR